MVGQGHFCKPIKFLGRNYLSLINGGTTLDNISQLTSMKVCIESCGTGDISSSIVTQYACAKSNITTLLVINSCQLIQYITAMYEGYSDSF